MSTGDLILALDYNAIREKVVSVLGTGYNTRGYGQQLNSNEAAIGYTITQEIWNELRLDLANILLHQTGEQPATATPVQGQVIRYGENYPVTNYDSLINDAILSRFSIGASRTLITAKESTTYTGDWDDTATGSATVTFQNADQARYFFNAGGKIRLGSSLNSETTTAQNTAWSNFLDSIGAIEFGAATPTDVTYYELTNNYQVVKKIAASTDPTSSYFRIVAKCNVSDNTLGTATTIDFVVEWVNGSFSGLYGLYGLYGVYGAYGAYGGATVSGTLLFYIDELKATGPIFPSGNFTITSPIYQMNPIIAE